MQFKKLDRNAPISRQSRSKSIEDIRALVAGNDRNIKISKYAGAWRVAIYRNTIKVAAVEVQGDLSEDQIIKEMRKEILAGTFDEEITKVYSRIYEERRERRKAEKSRSGG